MDISLVPLALLNKKENILSQIYFTMNSTLVMLPAQQIRIPPSKQFESWSIHPVYVVFLLLYKNWMRTFGISRLSPNQI